MMRDVSKAKFDGSLLVFAPLEGAVDDPVWLSMGTMRANLVRSLILVFTLSDNNLRLILKFPTESLGFPELASLQASPHPPK